MRALNTCWRISDSMFRNTSLTPKSPMIMGTSPTPSLSVRVPKVKRATPEIGIDADRPQEHAEQRHGRRAELRAPGEVRDQRESQEQDGEDLGRAEAQRGAGQRRRQQGDAQHAQGPRDERSEGGDAQRGARAPRARHLVAVQARDDGGGFAGDVGEDRRRRAAVHGTVVDARQHDDRGRRRHGVGDGEQQRHGGHRADSRQHADERSHEDADEARHEVRRGEADRESEDQAVEKIHPATTPRGPRAA